MSSEIFNQCSPSKKSRPTSMSTQFALQEPESVIFLHELEPATPEMRKIRIRVVRMWKDYYFNNSNKRGDNKKFGIGLILADEKGNFANARVTPFNEGKFKRRLAEQGIYEMWKFNVHPTKKGYTPVKQKLVITLEPDTQLTFGKKNIPNIPTMKPFEFVNLEDVPTMLSNEFLIDVIGFIASYPPVISYGTKKNKYIVLQDEKGGNMKITIWEEQFELFDEKKVQDKCVVVITSVSVSEYKGEISLSTKPSTLIFYDLNIPEVHALKESGKAISVKKLDDEEQIKLKDWQNYNKSTLGEIIELYDPKKKVVLYSCECTITDFHKIWSYSACEECLHGLQQHNKGKTYCTICKDMKNTFQAYNADVQIADNTHTLEATIWATALLKFFGINIHDLPHLASIGVELDSMFKQKVDSQQGTFQIRITTYKEKMSVTIRKFSTSTKLLQQNNHEDEDHEDEQSPTALTIDEFTDVNKSSNKVATPAKKETTVIKKRKAQTSSDDGNESSSTSDTDEDE